MKMIATICALSVFVLHAQANIKKSNTKKLPKVYVKSLQKEDIARIATYTGKLEPKKLIHIFAPVEGILERVFVRAGQKVKRGQVLALLRQYEFGAQVNAVRIRAPFNGLLYGPAFSESAMVSKNKRLFTVYDPTSFKLILNLTPDDSSNLNIDDSVTLKLKEKNMEAKIIAISPDLDAQTGTQEVEALISNTKELQLKPGMIAEAIFKFEQHKGFLIDKKNLKRRNKSHYIRLISKDSKIVELPVELGVRKGNQLEIISDKLKSGDRLVHKSSVEPLAKDQSVKIVEKTKKAQKPKGKAI